jgi:Family of unknown function (DUF6236)
LAIPFSSALYYPYIDIQNERWLRSAALFWDSIRSIVPDSVRDPYSSDFARELSDEGALEPIRVMSDMDEVDSLTDTVLDFLNDPTAAAVMLDTDARPNQPLHREKMPRQLRELVEIHPEKLPYVIRSQLRDALNDGGWYEVEPGFANFYMTLLATKLAERLRLGLVTESNSADQLAIAVHKGHPLASYFGPRRPGRHYEATGPRRRLPTALAPGLLIDLVLQSIELPEDVSARSVLRFKRDHREELAVFRREVSRLTNDIPTDMSVEALRQLIHDQYEAEVAPAMRSLRQSLRSQGWEAALNGLLKVSFFSAAPTSAAILAGVPGTVALLAGAGVSLTASAVLLMDQRQRTRLDTPYSYLLSLECRRW